MALRPAPVSATLGLSGGGPRAREPKQDAPPRVHSRPIDTPQSASLSTVDTNALQSLISLTGATILANELVATVAPNNG